MEYTCNASAARATFGCLNGGNCSFSETIGQYCICPEGYVPDRFGFVHFPNCAVPQDFILYYFIASSILVAIFIPVALTAFLKSNSRSVMVRVGKAAFLCGLFSYFHV